MKWWKDVRENERAYTLSSFLALFGISASHLMLETARDALFLTRVQPERLPLVYLAISVVALVITQVQRRRTIIHGECKVLGGWMMASGVVTLGFWIAIGIGIGDWVFYLLYVWSGVLVTLLIVHFWTLLNDHFNASSARRLYSVIALGSILGAVSGSGLARVLTELTSPRHLVLASGLLLIATAFGPVPRLHTHCELERSKAPSPVTSFVGTLRLVFGQAYSVRVVALVAFASVTLTLGDYVFKTAVVRYIDPDEMARFLSSVYLAFTVAALIIQVLVADRVLRRFSIFSSMAVLPLLLLLGGAAFAAVGGIAAALLVKAGDGALRHALHRTASELLYVPMSDHVRSRAKLVGEVLGQRGGQAFASVSILVLVGIGAEAWQLGVLLVALSLGWLGLLARLPRSYLDNFRRALGSGHVDYPEIDEASEGALRAALDSPDDGQVVAALEILRDEGRVDLIPNLMLHHPSSAVVKTALGILSSAHSPDFVAAADRALDRVELSLRPAVIRARLACAPAVSYLEARLGDADGQSRATAMVYLLALGHREPGVAHDFLDGVASDGEAAVRLALAEALLIASPPGCEALLMRLARDEDLRVKRGAIEAMAHQCSDQHLPLLIELLGQRTVRASVLETLRAYGDRSTSLLIEALEDGDLSPDIRWQVPGALAQIGTSRVARALLETASRDPSGMIKYRCLRAIERLPPPALRDLDAETLEKTAQSFVTWASRMLEARVCLVAEREARPQVATEVQGALIKLLADKERHAIDSLLRVIAAVKPHEDINRIREVISHGNPEARSSARELLESIIEPPLKGPTLALCDIAPPEQRLAALRRWFPQRALGYDDVLAELQVLDSQTLRALTQRHGEELLGSPSAKLRDDLPVKLEAIADGS